MTAGGGAGRRRRGKGRQPAQPRPAKRPPAEESPTGAAGNEADAGAAPAAEPVECNALIFVPGIGEWTDQSLGGITERIARALDIEGPGVEFSEKVAVRQQEYGPANAKAVTGIRSIFKSGANQDAPVIDVYELRYQDTLVKRFAEKNLLTKSFLTLGSIRRWFARFRSREKTTTTRAERSQMRFGAAVLALLSAYSLFVLFGVGQLGWTTYRQLSEGDRTNQAAPAPTPTRSPAPTATPRPERPSDESATDKGWPTPVQTVILLLTAAGILGPNVTKRLKRAFENGAMDYRGVVEYLDLSERRAQVIGQLDSLVNFVVDRKDRDYKRVDIIAYSFGTVVTYDTLFPPGRESNSASAIKSFVTIGSPYDLIRTYWRDYFLGRGEVTGRPEEWINIYSPADVLGSTFKPGVKEPNASTVNVAGLELDVENLPYLDSAPYAGEAGIGDIILLRGFKAHQLYWGDRDDMDTGCFSIVVKRLYAEDDVVGG